MNKHLLIAFEATAKGDKKAIQRLRTYLLIQKLLMKYS